MLFVNIHLHTHTHTTLLQAIRILSILIEGAGLVAVWRCLVGASVLDCFSFKAFKTCSNQKTAT